MAGDPTTMVMPPDSAVHPWDDPSAAASVHNIEFFLNNIRHALGRARSEFMWVRCLVAWLAINVNRRWETQP